MLIKNLVAGMIFSALGATAWGAGDNGGAERLFCMKANVSKPFEMRTFIARYRANAIKEGKATDIHSLLKGDHRVFVVDDNSAPDVRQAAADLSAFGAFDREYRYEDPMLGARSLYVYSPEADKRLYMRIETQASGQADAAFCPMKVRSTQAEGGRWKFTILPYDFMPAMEKDQQLFLMNLTTKDYPYQGAAYGDLYDEKKLSEIERNERIQAQKAEQASRAYAIKNEKAKAKEAKDQAAAAKQTPSGDL